MWSVRISISAPRFVREVSAESTVQTYGQSNLRAGLVSSSDFGPEGRLGLWPFTRKREKQKTNKKEKPRELEAGTLAWKAVGTYPPPCWVAQNG